MYNIMEPNLRDRTSFFRAPWIIRLSSSKDESPIDSPNVSLFENRQMSDKL